jgi:hypothetical protein
VGYNFKVIIVAVIIIIIIIITIIKALGHNVLNKISVFIEEENMIYYGVGMLRSVLIGCVPAKKKKETEREEEKEKRQVSRCVPEDAIGNIYMYNTTNILPNFCPEDPNF